MDEVYGLIGPNIMRHLVWEIDFQKQIIVLSKRLDKRQRDSISIEIPLNGSNYLSTNIKFRSNGISKKVRIDFGNPEALSLTEDLLIEDSLNFKKKKILGIGSKGLGYANNNMSLDDQFYLVDSLIFVRSGYSVSNIPVDASPSSFNFLGLGFFKKYKTIISWKDRVLILSPYDSIQNFVWKTHGFSTEYNEQNNKVEIASITDNTPASRAGLPLFSEVVSINQKTFSTPQSYCEFEDSKLTNDTINIKVKHNDLIQVFELIKEPLFDVE